MNKPMNNSYIEVDLARVRANASTIIDRLPEGVGLIPVLKDDAYGLGSVPVARALETVEGISCFALAHVSEGLELRKAGIDKELLITGSALPFQMEAAVEAGLILCCGRPGMAAELAHIASRQGRQAKIHLKVDTGLHRIGLAPGEELDCFVQELKAAGDSVLLTGCFSHFSDAANEKKNRDQYQLFQSALSQLETAGIDPGLRHISCSLTTELYPEYSMDAVRCGRRLYMDNPTKPLGCIKEVASWRSYIGMIKELPAGQTVGYGNGFALERDSRIATVMVGYGDGLNQELVACHAPVLIAGQQCRLLGCCMDQCMVDVTGVDCQVGDEVTLFGYDSDGVFLSSQELALLIGGDEGCGLTSALSPRVARVYLN